MRKLDLELQLQLGGPDKFCVVKIFLLENLSASDGLNELQLIQEPWHFVTRSNYQLVKDNLWTT